MKGQTVPSSSVFGHLEASLNDYFSDLTRRGGHADAGAAMQIAHVELPRVVSALRAALAHHRPDERGRCRGCRPRWFARSRVPCRAYLTAHVCLLRTEDADR